MFITPNLNNLDWKVYHSLLPFLDGNEVYDFLFVCYWMRLTAIDVLKTNNNYVVVCTDTTLKKEAFDLFYEKNIAMLLKKSTYTLGKEIKMVYVNYQLESSIQYGIEQTYHCGKLHSIDGRPAYKSPQKICYCDHGVYHRYGGEPAVIFTNGLCEWFYRGIRFRPNGQPTRINKTTGERDWHVNGEWVRSEMACLNVKTKVVQVQRSCGDAVYNKCFADQVFFDREGREHNDHGPAIIYEDGTEAWMKHGKLHCDHGPALITADGNMMWFYDGVLHLTSTCDDFE